MGVAMGVGAKGGPVVIELLTFLHFQEGRRPTPPSNCYPPFLTFLAGCVPV